MDMSQTSQGVVWLNGAGESTGLSLQPPNVATTTTALLSLVLPGLPGLQPLGPLPGTFSAAPLCAGPLHSFTPPPGSPAR